MMAVRKLDFAFGFMMNHWSYACEILHLHHGSYKYINNHKCGDGAKL
jgi:hypothetical protein